MTCRQNSHDRVRGAGQETPALRGESEDKLSYTPFIKEIGRGADGARDLTPDEAHRLYAAMLDGGVPDLELGAILLGLRVKGEAGDEMLGFLAAIDERMNRLQLPHGRVRPVILPSYNGARKEANLTPLLALLLQRFGVPVLVHGLIEGYGRVTSGLILRELGIMPSASPTQAQQALGEKGIAFVPLSVLCPGLRRQVGFLAGAVVTGQDDRAHPAVRQLKAVHALVDGGQEAEHFVAGLALDAQAEQDGAKLEIGHAAVEHRRVEAMRLVRRQVARAVGAAADFLDEWGVTQLVLAFAAQRRRLLAGSANAVMAVLSASH
jgi:hypothetical protein